MNTFQIICIFILATLSGILYIYHGVNLPDKDKIGKFEIIGLGSTMIILGMVILLIHIVKHNV